MKKKTAIGFFMVSMLFSTGVFAAPASDAGNQVRFPAGRHSGNIGIELFDNVIYIPVRINQSTTLDFVLDTGASDLTAIDQGNAASMGLSLGVGSAIGGAGAEQVRTHTLEGVTLSVPGMEMSGFRVITLPLKRMEPYWGRKKEGLLGGNILSRVVTQLDYDKRLVVFFAPESFVAIGKGQVIPLQVDANTPFVKAKIGLEGSDQTVEGLFMLDTGVRMTFINTPFTARHRLIEKSRRQVENITGFGIGGKVTGIVGRVASIRIGDFVLDHPVVELCTQKEGIGASGAFDGIIGADILSRFHVFFDYTRQQVILEKNGRFEQPFAYDMSGIYFITEGDKNDEFRIANVIKGSPAAEAGVETGDVILRVNEMPVSAFTMETLKRFFKEDSKAVTIRVRRNGKILSFSFRLQCMV